MPFHRTSLSLPAGVLLVFSLLLSGTPVCAQSPSSQPAPTVRSSVASPPQGGMPFPSKHYSGNAYGGSSRNWAVVQDSRGIVYLGSKDGLYSYDGEQWRSLPLPADLSSHTVRSLAVTPNDRLSVGFNGDFGMMAADSTYTLAFRSLAGKLPDDLRPVGNVWATFSTEEGTYFQTRKALIRWNGTDLRTWTPSGGIHTAFSVRGDVYVRSFDQGLLTLTGDSLRLVPGGETFEDRPVQAMIEFPGDRVLIGTSTDGLYLMDDAGIRPFPTGADDYFSQYRLYDGIAVSRDVAALSTLGGGIVLVDTTGRHVQTLRPNAELEGSTGNDLHVGRDGQLWIAFHNTGLQRLQVLSPITRFGKTHGLEGLIASVKRHEGTLYVGSGAGLYRYRPLPPGSRSDRSSFVKVPDVPFVLDMASTAEGLLVGTEMGLFRVEGDRVRRLTRETVFSVKASDVYPGRYYLGTLNGLAILPSLTSDPVQVEGISSAVRSVSETSDGALWVPRDSTLVRIQSNESAPRGSVSEYTRADGLPRSFSGVVSCGDRIYTFGRLGVRRIETRGNRIAFVADSTFFRGVADEGNFHYLSTATDHTRWVVRGDRVYKSPPRCASGRLPEWKPVPALHFPKSQSIVTHIDSTGTAWVSDGPLLYRYDLVGDDSLFSDTRPLVRRVIRLTDESTLYGGAPLGSASTGPSTDPPVFSVPYSGGTLRFEFATPLYNVTTPNRYQVRLEGHDDEWSDWSTSTVETYTNLWEGTYRLRIRARSERGTVWENDAFVFHVQPPWYRSTWAYVLYAVLGAGVVAIGGYGVLLYRETQRRRKQAVELRRQKMANERLREANDRLREANQLKENFLASTSHELRTPLSNMMGYADVIAEEAPSSLQPFAEAIQESGEDLLRTLDALLYLSGLRAGAYSLDPQELDFRTIVRECVSPFTAQADECGIALTTNLPDEPVTACIDPTASEQIVKNLVDNAVKFTREGSVRVGMRSEPDAVVVTVTDTGVGIAEEFRPHLFEDFKQESEGLTREYSGTGIGLAVTKRFADLIGAGIEVESEKGVGTRFTVRFPRSPATQAENREERAAKSDGPSSNA